MQQRSARRRSGFVQAVPDDPADALYHASRVGAELAVERSDVNELVIMRKFDLLRYWLPQRQLQFLGLPRFSPSEVEIVNHLLSQGRPDEQGYLMWTALRPGQKTIIASLVHETRVKRQHINTALNQLCLVRLVQRILTHGRQAVRITDHFHRMMFEARWRNELYNSAPELTEEIVAKKNWKWLLLHADELFYILNPRKVEDRRTALGELARRVGET